MSKPLKHGSELDRIADIFRVHGYDGASLALLSDATGWGRASLYHHFPGGKVEIASRAITHVGEKARAVVLQSLRGAGTPTQKIKRFSASVARFYRNGQSNCIVGSMVLSSGREVFADALRDAVCEWLDALAAVLVEAGLSRAEANRRAENAVAQIQGALILTRCLRSEEPFQRMMRELPSLLLAR